MSSDSSATSATGSENQESDDKIYATRSNDFQKSKVFYAKRKLRVEPWFYPFIDVIYVAAIKNIGMLATECNSMSFIVYLTMASFLAIMFSTRLAFDVYSQTYETRFTFNNLFVFLYTVGIFFMSFFIAVNPSEKYITENQVSPTCGNSTLASLAKDDEGFHFGNCKQSFTNSFGFSAAFLLTRFSLMIAYGISLIYKRKAITIGAAVNNEKVNSNHGDLTSNLSFFFGNKNKADNKNDEENVNPSVDQIIPNNQSITNFEHHEVFQFKLRKPEENWVKVASQYASKKLPFIEQRVPFYRGVALGYQLGKNPYDTRNSEIMQRNIDHVEFEFIFRVCVFLMSSFIVAAGFERRLPEPYWLCAAAAVEFSGDMLKDNIKIYYFADKSNMSFCDRLTQIFLGLLSNGEKVNKAMYSHDKTHFESVASKLQERLGLFFMLILGEAVLGLVIAPVSPSSKTIQNGMAILIFSFLILFTVGHQYFVSTVKSSSIKDHGIISYRKRNTYIWLHVVAAFSMLMVSNALENLFEESQHSPCPKGSGNNLSHHDDHYYDDGHYLDDSIHGDEIGDNNNFANRMKMAIGLAVTWLCMICIRMLHAKKEPKGDNRLIFGIHIQRTKFFVRIVTIIAHLVGTIPHILHNHNSVIYHGCVVCIPWVIEKMLYAFGNFDTRSDKFGDKNGLIRVVELIEKQLNPINHSIASNDSNPSFDTSKMIQDLLEKENTHLREIANIPFEEYHSTLVHDWMKEDENLMGDIFTLSSPLPSPRSIRLSQRFGHNPTNNYDNSSMSEMRKSITPGSILPINNSTSSSNSASLKNNNNNSLHMILDDAEEESKGAKYDVDNTNTNVKNDG
eukprot:gene10259-13798_t